MLMVTQVPQNSTSLQVKFEVHKYTRNKSKKLEKFWHVLFIVELSTQYYMYFKAPAVSTYKMFLENAY